LDPNPKVAGRGVANLRGRGVDVTVGVSRRACRHLVEDFACAVVAGRAWVTVKYAMSLDGKIATRAGDARWISGEEGRRYAHELRREHAAVVVGVGTVAADDPQLTVRLAGFDAARGPVRVVVSSDATLPDDVQLLASKPRPPVWVACTAKTSRGRITALTRAGAEVIICDDDRGRVAPESLLRRLAARGVNSALVEGGEALLGSFFDARLVDRVAACVSPKVIGGRGAKTPVGGVGVARAEDALVLREVTRRRLGADVVIGGYLTDVNTFFAGVNAADGRGA
jgi:diaminohydroxyphosphoribosylaminopyrimidine deaminase/5-amino-6-(5-phosphoribosylamino)uracil reductase